MRNVKIGIISSFHRNSMPFHKDALDSVLLQSDKDFTFFLFCDELDMSFKELTNSNVVYEKISGLAPREIKMEGILKAAEEKCDYICFLDSDDIMARNRIERLRYYAHKHYGLSVIHNMSTIDDKNNVLLKYALSLENMQECNYEFFLDKNISGFGNTLYYTQDLVEILPITSNTESLDWDVAALISLKNSFIVRNDLLYQYRQYNSNCHGFYSPFTIESFENYLSARDKHYEFILQRLDYMDLGVVKQRYFEIIDEWEQKKTQIKSNISNYLSEFNRNLEKLRWFELL